MLLSEKGTGSANKAFHEDSCSRGGRMEAPLAGVLEFNCKKKATWRAREPQRQTIKRKQGVHPGAAGETGGNADPLLGWKPANRTVKERRQLNRDVEAPGKGDKCQKGNNMSV